MLFLNPDPHIKIAITKSKIQISHTANPRVSQLLARIPGEFGPDYSLLMYFLKLLAKGVGRILAIY